MKRNFISLLVLIIATQFCFGGSVTEPANLPAYYSTLNNASAKNLFDAVHTVARKNYSSLSYAGLWTAYKTTDVYPSGHIYAGKIWDMYGGCEFTYSTNQCGTYSVECDCYNREHSIPKSWFGSSESANTPGTDIFHVVPTDGKVNGMRSNYAFGEVNNATYTYNGSKLGTPKSITVSNTLLGDGEISKSCGSSPVFEPIDEYKGDFARGYFGAMVRWANGDYQAFTSGDGGQIFNTAYDASHYYGLTQYGLALLLKWHRQDPVSQKEIDRNNGIQTTQGNRNPFIDYPILVEYIWGKYAGQTFTTDNAVGSFEDNFKNHSDGDKNGGSTPTPTTQYTITWNVKGVTTSVPVNENASPSVPSPKPADCSESRVFVGWTASSTYTNETTAPSDLFTESAPKATEDKTYYAVYADQQTIGSGSPVEVEMIAEFNGQGVSGTGSEITATKSGVTLTFSKGYGASATVIRAYAGGTLTFTSSSSISEIKLTTNASKGNAADVALTSGGGSYTASGTSNTSGTWTGSSKEIVLSNSAKQVQFTGIVIKVGSGTSTTYTNYSLSCSGSGSGSGSTGGSGLIDLGVDPDYYAPIEGLRDSVLKSTLGALTYAHFTTRYSYGSGNHNTWHALWTTDRNESDNSVVDMYSNNKRYFNPSDTTASVADCDIEHMFPNSWWGAKAGNRDAYEDLHHLVPADYSANRSKSNHGPGIPTDTTFNNGVWVNGSDATRDNIVVFCPPDEYKGDFARAFFYIATTYGDTAVWQKEGLTAGHMTNDDWHEFLPAMRELLLSWHRNDPVSDKERVRMHKVYLIQGNRNPFIDYPCLAEYIWGDKQGQTVALSTLASAYDDNFVDEGCVTTTEPTIILPTNAVNIGMTTSGTTISKTITVKGINLTDGNLTLALSGTNASLFSLSKTSISKANATSGQAVTISYKPTANGNHNALLTISGCGVSPYAVSLSGSCAPKYTATWMVEGEQLTTTTAFAGLMPSLPTQPNDCDAPRVFVGWTAASSVSDRPSDLFIDEAPALNSNTVFYAVYADEDKHLETSGTQTYTFSNNKWAASPTDWISGKNGFGYTAGKGVQVSLSTTGANAACPTEYTNVTTITVNYCTNASAGAGSVTMYVGENSITQTVTKTGGTTLRNLEFDFSATRPSGEIAISVESTENSVYINSVKITYGAPPTYSEYSLSCTKVSKSTVIFMNNGQVYKKVTDYAGTAITDLTNPTACDGYTFVGWSTKQYTADNTGLPEIETPSKIPATDMTYYAVYSREVSSESTSGAEVGTVLWAEDFSGFNNGDIPSADTKGTPTVYGGQNVTYASTNGGGTTKIFTGTVYAGGTSPELLIAFGNGTFSISGIPTGKAEKMTLTFKTNKTTTTYCLVSSSTDGITVGTQTITNKISTCEITNAGHVETFDLTITNTHSSQNGREDDFELTVQTSSTTSGTKTTYYTTEPDCTPIIIPDYTVVFMNGDEKFDEVIGHAGEEISVGEPMPSCMDYTFYGWSDILYGKDNTFKPAKYVPTVIPNEDKTYYAVYTKTEEAGFGLTNQYKKITNTDELTDANYLVVADTSKLLAMSSDWKNSYYLGSVEVTEDDGLITTDNEKIIWNINRSEVGLSFHNSAVGYLYIETSINGETTYYNIKLGDNTETNKFSYEVKDGVWVFSSVSYPDRQIEYYKKKAYWSYYTAQGAPIYLYKQQEGLVYKTYYTTSPDCSSSPSTAIESQTMNPTAQKMVINGTLFILREGKLYDARGQRVL